MLTQAIARYPVADFASEVLAGLTKLGQKELPSKYLYDEVGSALFEVISVLPEYGLTRADARLLRYHADEIVRRIASPVLVAELGSGSAKKTRWILEALSRRQRTTYFPIDISPTALAQSEKELGQIDFVSIVGYERPYLDGLLAVAASRHADEHLLVLFLGSTIGNFDRPAGEDFLGEVRRILYPGDALLLGTDLMKPVAELLAAYDDSIGVTAAFNLNMLARINRELDANFDLLHFRHAVRYNEQERRIEMHLRSTREQTVEVRKAGFRVHLARQETIWTESSHKYFPEEVVQMAERTGFRCDAQWVDEEWPFAQSLLIAK
ncbi:MAG: L-histidine N(alpha)-methyltransferase [Acidobacteria bacterium]|nr:L-histidine N(alpha)-methyltransferase [Acidobacteriota bacterium]